MTQYEVSLTAYPVVFLIEAETETEALIQAKKRVTFSVYDSEVVAVQPTKSDKERLETMSKQLKNCLQMLR